MLQKFDSHSSPMNAVSMHWEERIWLPEGHRSLGQKRRGPSRVSAPHFVTNI